MSPISLALPRPILKHSSHSRPDLSDDTPRPLSLPAPRQCRNTVHFPPSPTLTRTFSAYSSSAYDRSPIVVLPNICALPARGCPGRTYIPGCAPSSKPSPSPHLHTSKAAVKAGGRHLHPRRTVGFAFFPGPTSDTFASESDVPHLVPDVSSESDESDGVASPPSKCDAGTAVPDPLTFLPFASLANLTIGDGLFHSPESPDEEDHQYHKYEEEKRRRRKRDRDHGKGGREQCPRQRTYGQDVSARDLERKPTDGIGEELEEDDEAEDNDIGTCRYKSLYLGTSLRGCGLEADDDTCLGGF